MAGLPYSRLTDAMRPQEGDDDPARLPEEDKTSAYRDIPNPNITDATADVGAAAWGQSETFRRLNCRGK